MKKLNFHTHSFSESQEDVFVLNLTPAEARVYDGFCSIGIHPWYIVEQSLDKLFADIHFVGQFNQVVAVGECGLDKYCDVDFVTQQRVFKRLITISELLKKPMIIHCVKAFDELIAMKKRYQPRQKWIIHGFRGKPEQALQLIQLDFCFSFGPEFNREAIRVVPLDSFFVETDDSNLPLENVYRKIADELQIDWVTLVELVKVNANNILKLKI